MVTLAEIETAVRAQRGSWHTLFRREGERTWQCILFPRHRLAEQAYRTLERRLSTPDSGAALSPAERQRNKVRAISDRADEGHRRGR